MKLTVNFNNNTGKPSHCMNVCKRSAYLHLQRQLIASVFCSNDKSNHGQI